MNPSRDDATTTFRDLTDLTLQRIHGVLDRYEAMDAPPLRAALDHHASIISQCYSPFSGPSKASRERVESGKVTLSDGTLLQVTPEDKETVWELSTKLDLDEVQALTLFRLFLFNEGLTKTHPTGPYVLMDALTDFYFEERLYAMRLAGALLRIKENMSDPHQSMASEFISSHIPNLTQFAQALLDAVTERAHKKLRDPLVRDPRIAARWAKQNLKEQLCLLEVIFWSAVAHTADPAFVSSFFEAIHHTNLGRHQEYKDLLLDDQSAQLFQDIQVLFGVTAVQLLKLDKLLDETLDLQTAMDTWHGYLSSPDEVDKIHNTVANFPDDAGFSPIVLAWGYIVSRISRMPRQEIPDNYHRFYEVLNPPPPRRVRLAIAEPTLSVADSVISRAVMLGLFPTLLRYLKSPHFSTTVAATLASAISDPNNGQYRYVLKCLVMAVIDTVQVEYIQEYELLVEVWTGIFGSGEMPVVVYLCSEFWTRDLQHSIQRRSLLDLALSRFPVEPTPLLKLLRAMGGSGGLAELDSVTDEGEEATLRLAAVRNVYNYFLDMQCFTQVLSPHHLSGPQALYETRPDPALGYYYTNSQAIRLPGGSILPAGSYGRVVSTQGAVVVAWMHKHSGWHLLLDVLWKFHTRITNSGSARGAAKQKQPPNRPVSLDLEDVGLQVEDEAEFIADILDLFRSLLHRNVELATQMVSDLRNQRTQAIGSDNYDAHATPDLIQVILLLLKDLLLSPVANVGSLPSRIVASAMGVLTALLPVAPGQVWPFLRSLPQLFGDERHMGTTPALLTAERTVGSYTMTLALLDLVGALFDEGFRMVLTRDDALQQMKTEVLLRALRFVHSEIWLEHSGWKYHRVADRFEIGRKVANVYGQVLELSPPTFDTETGAGNDESTHSPLLPLTHFVLNTFLFKATSSTVNQLVASIATIRELFEALQRALRFVDASNLISLLQANLRLIQLVLVRKRAVSTVKLSLLEQTLFSGLPAALNSFAPRSSRLEPIDVIARLIENRSFGQPVATQATQLLSVLCSSTASVQPSCPSIVGHLNDPEGTAEAFIRVLTDPYDDLELRKAMWDLVATLVDTQPAFASLLISGTLRSSKQTSHDTTDAPKEAGTKKTVLSSACDIVGRKVAWDALPAVFSAALNILDLVWQHALQHVDALKEIRENQQFWRDLASVASRQLGPPPVISVEMLAVESANGLVNSLSQLDRQISRYSYHATAKAHALHVLAMDLKLASPDGQPTEQKPLSFDVVADLFRTKEDLEKHIVEAIHCPFMPSLHRHLQELINTSFPTFTLNSVRFSYLPSQRSYGNHYLYQSDVVQARLMKCAGSNQELGYQATSIYAKTCGVNLNWSLTDAQVVLMRSWGRLLQDSGGWLRSKDEVELNVLASASKAAKMIAEEARQGDVMRAIHAGRLSLLQGLLEVAWLSGRRQLSASSEIPSLLNSVRFISSSEVFPPLDSIRRQHHPTFHHTLLRIIYFTVHKATLLVQASTTKLEQRLAIGSSVNETLGFVIDGLRCTFDLTYTSPHPDLDQDMKLLVAVFEKCTKPELHSTPSPWLSRCQEVDLIRSSLDVLVRSDLGREVDKAQGRKPSPVAQQILYLHVTLSRIPAAAERLAVDGVIAAYTKTTLTPYLEAGTLGSTLSNQPGEYNPSHRAWCTMLGVSSTLTHVIGQQGQFIGTEILGFVQLCGAQLTKVLGWTFETPLTLTLLEEMHRTVHLFHAIAVQSMNDDQEPSGGVQAILQAFTERALLLLQQLNFVLSHPNHLSTLLEAVTPDERKQMDKEIGATPLERPAQSVDPGSHPLLASVVQKLLTIFRDVTSTLLVIGRSDMLFRIQHSVQWARFPPYVVADTKVARDGPASIGTLRESAAFALDVVCHLLKPEKAKAKANRDSVPSSIEPFDASRTKEVALQVVEEVSLYAFTQLSSAVHQPYGAVPVNEEGDVSMDDRERSVFGKTLGPMPLDPIRLTRQWKELAVEINLLVKGVPHDAGPGVKEFFGEIAKATYNLVQTLDKKLKEGR